MGSGHVARCGGQLKAVGWCGVGHCVRVCKGMAARQVGWDLGNSPESTPAPTHIPPGAHGPHQVRPSMVWLSTVCSSIPHPIHATGRWGVKRHTGARCGVCGVWETSTSTGIRNGDHNVERSVCPPVACARGVWERRACVCKRACQRRKHAITVQRESNPQPSLITQQSNQP